MSVDVIKWGFIIVGLILINVFPVIIDRSYSGLVLALGIILFVNGAIWNI